MHTPGPISFRMMLRDLDMAPPSVVFLVEAGLVEVDLE